MILNRRDCIIQGDDWQCLETLLVITTRGGDNIGICWAEARNADKILQCPGQTPEQRIIWLKMSRVARLRSPDLGVYNRAFVHGMEY